MVDIHAHIIPGLDDGAENMEESLKMAEMAVSQGIFHMVASSHGNYYSYTLEEYYDNFFRLKNELEKNNIPLKIYPGMEIFMNKEVVHFFEKKELLSLNRTKYFLVEFPFDESTGNVLRRLKSLKNRDCQIVLAHPERYLFKIADDKLCKKVVGGNLELYLSNLMSLKETGRIFSVRIPLIPHYTSSKENLQQIIKILKDVNPKKIELIKGHNLAKNKYISLGRKMFDVEEIGEQELGNICNEFLENGLKAEICKI